MLYKDKARVVTIHCTLGGSTRIHYALGGICIYLALGGLASTTAWGDSHILRPGGIRIHYALGGFASTMP